MMNALGSLPETDLCTILFIFVQVRVLFEMLVRKCGLQAVSAVTPEPHAKLITHIRKVYVMHDYEGISFYFKPKFHFDLTDITDEREKRKRKAKERR